MQTSGSDAHLQSLLFHSLQELFHPVTGVYLVIMVEASPVLVDLEVHIVGEEAPSLEVVPEVEVADSEDADNYNNYSIL